MKLLENALSPIIRKGLIALLAASLPILAHAAPHEEVETSGRASVMEMEAVVTAVNLETREVSLEGPNGNIVTIHAQEQIVKLEDVSVGDRLVVTYMEALEAEIRTPTEEELAEPWVVLEDTAVSEDAAQPAVMDARMVRAVVTIEGLNRPLGTATIKDSRGMLHILGDVEPEKMEGVTLGQTAVVIYAQALALSLEKKEPDEKSSDKAEL